MQPETSEIRHGDALNCDALAAYLRWHMPADTVPGLDFSREMHVAQFLGGHSNLTYLVRFGGAELVVRRPPVGPVAPKAHDVAREYRWLAALHPIFPLAPRPYLLCEDVDVIGSVFYVMERRRGVVVRHEEPLGLAHRPDARRAASEAIVDTLADLHVIPVTEGPLADLGKPSGFVDRQVRGWIERWHRAKLEDIPEMDAVAEWIGAHLPEEPLVPAVVHGDFKLDNVLLDPLDPAHVVAVLDWEMSALGDPLVDLGILLTYWSLASSSARPDALTTVTKRPGWFTRDEIVERYRARCGRGGSSLHFYETLAMFKIAVVIQQLFYRYKRGHTDDARFATFGERVVKLAREAAARAQMTRAQAHT